MLLCCLSLTLLQAQEGVRFESLTFKEALEKAKKENRWIFLDAYTSWCGPCKVMAEQVFTRAKAGEFFNSRFVNVKYDMEKGEGPELAKKLGIGAYPTFVLIRPDGVVHDKLVGGADVDGIIQRVEHSMKQTETVGTLAVRYDQGERDKEFLLKYLRALSDASEVRRLREVAGILSGQLTDIEKIDSACWILFDNNDLAPFNSANYRFLLEHRKQFSQRVGLEKVDRRLGMLYAGVLSSIVWGRDTKTTLADVQEIGKVIRTLKTDDKKRLLAYVNLANAYKEKNTGELLKLVKKVFPVFSDADVMLMVMPVSVYFRTQENKAALKEFIQVGRGIIPNLKIQENINYVTYYFDELEKQM
mgnify:FL=1